MRRLFFCFVFTYAVSNVECFEHSHLNGGVFIELGHVARCALHSSRAVVVLHVKKAKVKDEQANGSTSTWYHFSFLQF